MKRGSTWETKGRRIRESAKNKRKASTHQKRNENRKSIKKTLNNTKIKGLGYSKAFFTSFALPQLRS
jgi:hypothetical protein